MKIDFISKIFNRTSTHVIVNVAVVFIILLLPYYYFSGRSFIGGDDTRLYYTFPAEFIENIVKSGWFNFSLVGSYNPNYFLLPLLTSVLVLKTIIGSSVIVSYFFFSLPLILGYFYFQKLLREIYKKADSTVLIFGSLVYVFSPIFLAVLIGHFLYAIWLIPLMPAILYYYLKFVTNNSSALVLLKLFVLAFWLEAGLYSIPWLMGLLLPITLSLLFLWLIRVIRIDRNIVWKTVLFVLVLFLSQALWLIPFIVSLLPSGGRSYAASALSSETADTFITTVLATSRGIILYPLLNLFHRQIAVDFNWPLGDVYKEYYDKIYYFSFVYILLIGIGQHFYKKVLNKYERKAQIFFIFALLLSLFFFTVNIGPLKEIFLAMGKIPGFAMFRNGYDKFAPGYIFIYAIVISGCLVVMRVAVAKGLLQKTISNTVLFILAITLVLGYIPSKKLIDKRLWKTRDIGTSIKIPSEYLKFMKVVSSEVPRTKNILSVPFGISVYTTIKDEDRNSVFTGRSPIQVFTGINDFSGTMSFPGPIGKEFEYYLQSRDYEKLRSLLKTYNIHYILETNNIPSQVLNSYLYSKPLLDKQDDEFRNNLISREVAKSTNGNYILYQVKESDENISTISAATEYFQLDDTKLEDGDLQSLRDLYSPIKPLILSGENIPKGQLIRRLSVNSELAIDSGEYYLHRSEKNLATLSFEDGSLIVNNHIGINLNGESIENGQSVKIDNFDSNSLVRIGDSFLDEGDLNDGYTISKNQKLDKYVSNGNNLAGNLADLKSDWSQGDCNRFDDFGEQVIEYHVEEGRESLELGANDQHNTCVWRSMRFKAEHVYRVSFRYKTNAEKLNVAITDNKALVASSFQLGTTQARDEWSIFTGYYVPTKDEEGLFILYSGQANDGAITEYTDLKVNEYERTNKVLLDNGFSQFPNTNLTIQTKEKTKLVQQPTNKDLAKDVKSFSEWAKADCNAKSADTATSFTEKNNSITLKSWLGHNGCILKKISINSNEIYQLEFKYSHNKSLPVYIDYGTEFGFQKFTASNGDFSEKINPPSGAEYMTIFLYSGKTGDENSETKYNSINLASYPKIYESNSIVEADYSNTDPIQTTVQKISGYEYNVFAVKTRENFILQLNDSFHSGWKLKINDKIINSKHFMVNGYSNGWFIDTAELCSIDGNCTNNDDGTFNINFKVYFEPQNWFYVGRIVSIGSLLALVLLTIASYFYRKYILPKNTYRYAQKM